MKHLSYGSRSFQIAFFKIDCQNCLQQSFLQSSNTYFDDDFGFWH